MLEKGKISAFQLGVMMYSTVLATGFLVLPAIAAQSAKNDLWLTGILASLIGFLNVYLVTRLHQLYPKETVIQYSEHIVGKIIGKIIGMMYFLYSLHTIGTISREYAEFVKGNFLFKTPLLLIISTIILLCAFAVRGGAELLARSAVVLTPLFLIPTLILLLLIPDADVKNIFPILSHGITPVIKGTITPQAWVSEFFLMTFFLPCLSDPSKGRMWGMISMSVVILSMVYVNLITLFLLGPDIGNKIHPILIAFRYIKLGNLFENMEVLLLALWIVGNFVKIGVFYYSAVFSFGQLFRLSDYRFVVFPLGLFSIVFSMWGLPNFSKLNSYLKNAAPFEITVIMTLIPLLLLIVAVLRKRKVPSKADPTP
ncbi:GerAB/ArcD/ProY family transporter [Paenibacillus sp. LMG 31458]|uniref:GerAB/ArcD/ProY family transporter n=1 Tax=Paenibacillus phytorum TaxID=2654977 RepID=A0ABX1Y2U6_9BACL|nr:endospore germination permease [Paenibacillus phytorum]NOU74909.1 GerAB/ArcD/ProY family transporter [Paenibacillus phytorum]